MRRLGFLSGLKFRVLPKRGEVAFLDANAFQRIASLLPDSDSSARIALDLRGTLYLVPAIFALVARVTRYHASLFTIYVAFVTRLSGASTVIVLSTNILNYLEASLMAPKQEFVAFQNGFLFHADPLSMPPRKLVGQSKNLKVLTFSTDQSQVHNQFGAHSEPFGSLRLGLTSSLGTSNPVEARIIFVSQFRPNFDPPLSDWDREFNDLTKHIYSSAARVAAEANLEIRVLLSPRESVHEQEKSFFRSLADTSPVFWRPKDFLELYSEVRKSTMIVGVNSTLIFEAMALGTRAFFHPYFLNSLLWEGPALKDLVEALGLTRSEVTRSETEMTRLLSLKDGDWQKIFEIVRGGIVSSPSLQDPLLRPFGRFQP